MRHKYQRHGQKKWALWDIILLNPRSLCQYHYFLVGVISSHLYLLETIEKQWSIGSWSAMWFKSPFLWSRYFVLHNSPKEYLHQLHSIACFLLYLNFTELSCGIFTHYYGSTWEVNDSTITTWIYFLYWI